MELLRDVSLKPFNTFGIDAKANYFARYASVEELQTSLAEFRQQSPKLPVLVLGGGSNVLLTSNFDGLVLKNEIRGIKKIREDDEYVYVQSGGGENWHQFVLHCISNQWAGVENLSLIPGSVGASPMQNIGAYGVELKDVFHELRAFHLSEKANYTFSAKDCRFGYRESVFKHKYKDQFVITQVCFRLRKTPSFNISYGAIAAELEKLGIKELTIEAVSNAVINIRQSKLPDPKEIGNAGSFFKNPTVSKSEYDELKSRYAGIVGYENEDGSIKLAAGWMIEQCGWKGYRNGDAGCYEKQALVLVNFGRAGGDEIFLLSEQIIQSVKEKFNVILEREVNII